MRTKIKPPTINLDEFHPPDGFVPPYAGAPGHTGGFTSKAAAMQIAPFVADLARTCYGLIFARPGSASFEIEEIFYARGWDRVNAKNTVSARLTELKEKGYLEVRGFKENHRGNKCQRYFLSRKPPTEAPDLNRALVARIRTLRHGWPDVEKNVARYVMGRRDTKDFDRAWEASEEEQAVA